MLRCPVDEALGGAALAGLSTVIAVGIDAASSRTAIDLAHEHSDAPLPGWMVVHEGDAGEGSGETPDRLPQVRATVGLHPHDAAQWSDEVAEELLELAADPFVVAVGECGLDFYRDLSPRDAQEVAFRGQIEVARRAGKPLVVHVREAAAEALDVLARHADDLTVVMHCFSLAGHEDECNERGYFASFAGNLTFKKAEELRRAARLLDEERLLVETDAPFLSPVPYRGKDNLPERVVVTAQALAAERGWDEMQADEVTTVNAERVFALARE